MMIKKKLIKSSFFLGGLFVLISCSHQVVVQNKQLESYPWSKQNYGKDMNNGISLEKLQTSTLLTNPSEQNVIVAVLDTQTDIDHEAISEQLWINEDEIPNNNIDDDGNGYVDDVNGWNFMGFDNDGYFRYQNFEYTRILRYKDDFLNKNSVYAKSDSLLSLEYDRAVITQKRYHRFYTNWAKSLDFSIDMWQTVTDSLIRFFPDEDYDLNTLDSLYSIYKINDKSYIKRRDDRDTDLGALIFYKIVDLETNTNSLKNVIDSKLQKDSIINYNLNVNVDRKLQFKRTGAFYGNNKLNINKYSNNHSTEVISIIAGSATKEELISFHKNIKVMPICISVSGDEHDEDVANGIRYAVDNGAKVINMSFGKQFSLYPEIVHQAFLYAQQHNVLLVHASGNDAIDIDATPFYPIDINYYTGEEGVQNFINVGAISKRTDSTMVSSFSNYGKKNVDIFAPGEYIHVAQATKKQYGYDSGTSLSAPLVSATAALLYLYFPKLSVFDIKECILESGNSIDKNVLKPGTKNEYVHFSELCSSGKILNVYAAFLMANKKSQDLH